MTGKWLMPMVSIRPLRTVVPLPNGLLSMAILNGGPILTTYVLPGMILQVWDRGSAQICQVASDFGAF